MKPASLLRWYPRAWRERYGEELLALIQDTLDGGRPTWRLRLSVAWGGAHERAHQVGQAVRAGVKARTGPTRWGTALVAGLIFADLPLNLAQSPPATREWQATTALDAVIAAVALTGALILAGGLAALPALVRFVRAGGWPKIRRPVAWAAGATAVAGGGLAGVAVFTGSHSFAQLNVSWAILAATFATGFAMTAAIGLSAIAAAATARHLTLTPRVRSAQLVLVAVTPPLVTVILVTLNVWWSVTQGPAWLVLALVMLGLASVNAWQRIPRAVRRGRRLRAAAGGATIVNPSAAREHGRHRA
jgi:hypothetical protein